MTEALVDRVVELVRSGTPLRELAVVTFTDADADELRARLTEALGAARRVHPSEPALAQTGTDLEEAAVSAVHTFARRLLLEHSRAAGLPPVFEVLDDLADRAQLESQIVTFTDQLLEDDGAEAMLLRGFVLGLDGGGIFEAASSLHRHWDRLAGASLEHIETWRPGPGQWPSVDVGRVLDALERVEAMEQWCTDDGDLLLAHLRGRLRRARAVLSAAAHDEQAALLLLVRLPPFTSVNGQRQNWGDRLEEVRNACSEAERTRQETLFAVRQPVLAELLARLARFTVDTASRRASEGRLCRHDLVVRARNLLGDDAAARASLRRHYRKVLVADHHGADPLQVELARFMASCVEGGGDLGSEHVLGSHSQSVPGIVRFVNAVFPALLGQHIQPGEVVYRPLVAERPPLPARPGTGAVQLELTGFGDPDAGPPEPAPAPVVVLGGSLDSSVGEVRRSAARELSSALRRAVAEGWVVSEPGTPGTAARRLRWGDVAVLIPTRVSLAALEEAFDDADVPYRLEGATLLWGSEEIQDVLCALRAADQPSDAVSVLAALRTPGLACGDDDLVEWHGAGGSWDPRADAPTGLERHAVARAMSVLAELHRRRWWSEPSPLVAAAIDEMHGYELAFSRRRPRQSWRRLRWLAARAQEFDQSVGGSLRDFLRWVDLQRQVDGGGDTPGPPDPADDAVRVMTVHGAGGMEFPVVALAGLDEDDSLGAPDAVLWRSDGGAEVRLSAQLQSAGYEEAAAEQDRLDRLERVHRLYEAMTSARDHLVLCLHHRTQGDSGSQAAAVEEQCRSHLLLWRRLPAVEVDPDAIHRGPPPRRDRAGPTAARPAGTPEGAGPGAARRWAADLGDWTALRQQTVARRRCRPVVGDRAPGDDTDAAVGGRPDFDRAVHGALGALDLRTGRDAAGTQAVAVALWMARLHGVADRAGEVAALVDAALSSPVLRRAAERPHHQEVHLAAALAHDDTVFEGVADLVVEDDDGLVVVDYRTDDLGAADRAQLAARHAPQVAAWAAAAEAATGRPVVGAVLLFLHPDGAWEHTVGAQGSP